MGSRPQKEIEIWGDEQEYPFDIYGKRVSVINVNAQRTMTPAILQTCRKCYIDANWILYSKNEFWFWKTEDFLKFSAKFGDKICGMIKKIYLRLDFYPWGHDTALFAGWLLSLEMLGTKTTALRQIKCSWDANSGWTKRVRPQIRGLPKPATMYGSEFKLKFFRALARFGQLKGLVISGKYAHFFPADVEEIMHLWLRAVCGWHFTKFEERDKNMCNLCCKDPIEYVAVWPRTSWRRSESRDWI